ncbi:MAG: alanyl-tRNA editing protein [Nitrososphaerales archaeon]
MTRRLYWEDMYLRTFDAKVVSSEGQRVVLDQTAFNPRGGGLVSDMGTVNGAKMAEAVKEGEEIVHLMESPATMKPGDVVHCVLDWERRFRIMRMHTTAHILSSVVNGETGALITGNQIAPDESRVDLSLDQFDREKLTHYIERVNDVVRRAVDVKTYFMKREEALATPGLVKLANAMPPAVEMLRIVQIGDVDTQADGGVHVKNTREIGRVTGLKTENKGKSNRRIYFTVD